VSTKVRKYLMSGCFVFFVLIISGCSSNFVRPDEKALILGKSVTADVTKVISASSNIYDATINNEKVHIIGYYYIHNNVFFGSLIPEKYLTYTFLNDVMVGDVFSSCNVDGEPSTDFDANKIANIQKGQSLDQVIAIMGKPSGKILYPLIADKSGSGIVYQYTYIRYLPLISPTTNRVLVITLDTNNLVTDISYKIDNKEQIAH
jgi:hypothetical protein